MLVGGASVLSAASQLVFQAILAKFLSASDYGLIASVTACINIAAVIAGLGISQYWIKEFGLKIHDANSLIRPSLRTLFLGVAMVTVLIVVGSAAFYAIDLIPKREAQVTALLTIGVPVAVVTDILLSRARISGNIAEAARTQIIYPLTRVLIALVLWFLGVNQVLSVAFVLFAAAAPILFAYGYRLFSLYRRAAILKISNDPRPNVGYSYKQVLAGAAPFAVASITYAIYYQSLTLEVRAYLGPTSSAQLFMALTVISGMFLIPDVLYQRILSPKFHHWYHHSPRQFSDVYFKSMAITGIAAVALALAIYFCAGPVMISLYGKKYPDVASYLQVLSFAVLFRFFTSSIASGMIAEHLIRLRATISLVAATTVILLGLWFIPKFGASAAAVIISLSEFISLVLCLAAASNDEGYREAVFWRRRRW